jgi:hypothetical protein
VSADKVLLMYALNSAYSGRKFLPGKQFETLEKDIAAIQGPLSVTDFCRQIDRSFSQVSDSHLAAKFKGKHCLARPERESHVGKNYFHSKEKFWDVRTKKIDGVLATLISVLTFPSHENPEWNGFLEKVKANLARTQVVIFDMRGNGGGDDTMGYQLAKLLAGANLKDGYLPQWTSKTPESMQLFINSFSLWKRDYMESHEPVPAHIEHLIAEFTQKRELAVEGKLSDRPFASDSEEEKEDFHLAKSIRKPIYILIDFECASSCESTTDAFEYNKLVKRVGERTAGYIHFGNNGNVVLTHSGIVLQMAVSYNQYKDGRFLEKKGIAPDIEVPPGQDALIFAIRDFKG